MVHERAPHPSVAILDGRTFQSTLESGDRAGNDEAKKKNGSKVHAAVDTLALKMTAANKQEGEQEAELAAKMQDITGGTGKVGFVD